jgi:putative redox protein
MATVHLDSRETNFAQDIRAGAHQLVADEPPSVGGQGAGFAPYELLLAALVACTSATLRMYAERKGWQLGPVHIDCVFGKHGDEEKIERTIVLAPSVPAEQRTRLAEIAEKTPVTKTIKRGTPIVTTFA